MITAYKYLPGDVGNEERELFMVSKGGRTRSGGLELRKGKFFCLALKKAPRPPGAGSAGAGQQRGRRVVNGDDEGKTTREVNLLTQTGSLLILRSIRCRDKFHLPYFTAGTL